MTTNKLVKKFADHCAECDECLYCRFFASGKTIGACLDAYSVLIESGEMTPEDGFETKGRSGMKASEVIARLQELIAEHGDCEVNAMKWDENAEIFFEFPLLVQIYHADGDGEEFFYFQYGKEVRND